MKFGRVIERASHSASTRSPPVTTPASCRRRTAPRSRAASTPPRTSRTCCTCSGRASSRVRCLPIGEMTKAEVRERAHALGPPHGGEGARAWTCASSRAAAGRVPRARIRRRPGVIVDAAGAAVGAHDGVDAVHDRAAPRHGCRAGRAPLRRRHRRRRRQRSPSARVSAPARSRAVARRRRSSRPPPRRSARADRARTASRSRPGSRATRCCSTRRSRAWRPARWSRATTATSCSAAASPAEPARTTIQPTAMRRAPASRTSASVRTCDTSAIPASTASCRGGPGGAANDCGSCAARCATCRPGCRAGGRARRARERGVGSAARRRWITLPPHEHRVGERERVDDDEAGGNEHEPPHRQRVQRAGQQRGNREAHDRRAPPRRRSARSRAAAVRCSRRRRSAAPRAGPGRGTATAGCAAGSGCSSPYASAFAVACATGADEREHRGDDARRSARAPRRHRRSLRSTTIARTHGHGRDDRAMRQPPRPGREQARPSRSTHAAHNSTAATTPGPVDQPSSASANAAPAATGSSTHVDARTTTSPPCAPLRSSCSRSPILRTFMPDTVFVARNGHRDRQPAAPGRGRAAAALVLRCLPELPAAPQLPMRTPLEGCRRPVDRVRSTACTSRTTARSRWSRRSTRSRRHRSNVRCARARRPAHFPRRGRRAPEAAQAGEGAVRRAPHARRGAGGGGRSRRRRVRARRPRGAARGRWRSKRSSPRAFPVRRSSSASTSPRSSAGTRAPPRSTVSSRPTSSRRRWPRPRASPASTCADGATCGSRSTPDPASCTSTSARSTSTTP